MMTGNLILFALFVFGKEIEELLVHILYVKGYAKHEFIFVKQEME